MGPIEHKINRSYESEPSSNSDSAEDTILTETQYICIDNPPKLTSLLAIQNFADSTPPSLSNIHEHSSKLAKRFGFVSCSEESDLDGFSDSNVKRHKAEAIRQRYDNEVPLRSSSSSATSSPEPKTQEANPPSVKKVEVTSDRQCSSAEMSDQDERCQREMKQHKFNLQQIIHTISEVSQYSIEPNSSDDEKAPVPPIFTNENSSNAVDNKLSTQPDQKTTTNELSFNGIIETMAKANKDETDKRTERLSLLENERSFMLRNEQSPDMFANSDTDEDDDDQMSTRVQATAEELPDIFDVSDARKRHIHDSDKVILGRIQSSLSGVLPPPSVTILQYNITELLNMYQQNYTRYTYETSPASSANKLSTQDTPPPECLFRPTHCVAELKKMEWPKCYAEARGHGIYYNRSVNSENIELLCMKYAERNIGAETSSSFAFSSPSSCKKRNQRMKMLTKSPGNRLSHLAKRRAIFSSANILKTSGSSVEASKLGKTQFVIDTRKCDRRGKTIKVKTPRRHPPGRLRTPGKSRTPGSARKRILPVKAIIPTRESSKRALFQSPPKEKPKPLFTPELASRVEKSKRALFSPPSNTLKRHLSVRSPPAKRSRIEDHSKIMRHGAFNAENLTPRSLLAKSQSFCTATMAVPTEIYADKSLARANSEQVLGSRVGMPQQLSQLHKQKLLWAVGTSLQRKAISSKHEHYRKYAAVLVKVVRRFFMEMPSRRSTSTSETMRYLADKHVFWVIQGKNEDEIYLSERQKMDSAAATRLPKVSGYVGLDEYEQRAKHVVSAAATMRRSSSALFQSESSMESFGQQSCSTASCVQSTEHLSQVSSQSGSCYQQHLHSNNNTMSATKPVLTNSSSKSNSKSSVLRENYDTEQRQKSGQKTMFGFSGKDQKNVSPYSDKVRNSLNKKLLMSANKLNANIMKAKRQISFDS